MRLFFAFFVRLILLIPAAVIADWSVDGLLPNSIESPSEPGNLNEVPRLDETFGSESIAGTSADCALDHIQFTGKLRARSTECENPENPGINENSGQNLENPGKDGNNGNSKKPKQFSDFELIWRPPQPDPKLSDLCPPDLHTGKQRIVCHEGPENEIRDKGTQILNAYWCTLFFFSKY